MERAWWQRPATSALAAMIIVGVWGGAAMAGDSEARLQKLATGLPAQIDRWQRAEPETYGPEDLYRYIDGGAELYIAYGFTAMLSQPYVDTDGREIRLDVFDMGSSAAAFGVFAHSRESVDRFVAPDVESEYVGGLLHFWKGRHYVSMLAYPETAAKRQLVAEVARAVAASIDAAGGKPALVRILPAPDRVPYSVRYFRHPAWINDYHDFGDENPLRICTDTEVAMARYRRAGGESPAAVVLAIRYASAAAATEAQKALVDLAPARDGSELVQQRDGTWLGSRREGDLLVVVADAPDRESAASWLASCLDRTGDHGPGGPR